MKYEKIQDIPVKDRRMFLMVYAIISLVLGSLFLMLSPLVSLVVWVMQAYMAKTWMQLCFEVSGEEF